MSPETRIAGSLETMAAELERRISVARRDWEWQSREFEKISARRSHAHARLTELECLRAHLSPLPKEEPVVQIGLDGVPHE